MGKVLRITRSRSKPDKPSYSHIEHITNSRQIKQTAQTIANVPGARVLLGRVRRAIGAKRPQALFCSRDQATPPPVIETRQEMG